MENDSVTKNGDVIPMEEDKINRLKDKDIEQKGKNEIPSKTS
jgi:hypothetical protein